MLPHTEPPFALPHPRAYAAVVSLAFSMRRKTLRNSLKSLLDVDAIRALGIDPAARAETLPPAAFAALAQSAAQASPDLR